MTPSWANAAWACPAGRSSACRWLRALADNPSILIMDDTTSAVDMETEAEIQKHLKEMDGGKTIVAIAHRISSVKDSDLILVFETDVSSNAAPTPNSWPTRPHWTSTTSSSDSSPASHKVFRRGLMAQRNTCREDEELEEQINFTTSLRVGKYLKPYMAHVVARILVVVISMSCIVVAVPYLTKIMIDEAVPNKDLGEARHPRRDPPPR